MFSPYIKPNQPRCFASKILNNFSSERHACELPARIRIIQPILEWPSKAHSPGGASHRPESPQEMGVMGVMGLMGGDGLDSSR